MVSRISSAGSRNRSASSQNSSVNSRFSSPVSRNSSDRSRISSACWSFSSGGQPFRRVVCLNRSDASGSTASLGSIAADHRRKSFDGAAPRSDLRSSTGTDIAAEGGNRDHLAPTASRHFPHAYGGAVSHAAPSAGPIESDSDSSGRTRQRTASARSAEGLGVRCPRHPSAFLAAAALRKRRRVAALQNAGAFPQAAARECVPSNRKWSGILPSPS